MPYIHRKAFLGDIKIDLDKKICLIGTQIIDRIDCICNVISLHDKENVTLFSGKFLFYSIPFNI